MGQSVHALSRRSFLRDLGASAAVLTAWPTKPVSNVQLSRYQHPTPYKRFAAPGPIDAAGDVAFTFPTLPVGNEAQVTLIVPGSPAGVLWTVNSNSQAIGSMVGNLPFGVLYISDSDTITITGTFFPFAEAPSLFSVGNAVMEGSTAPTGVLGPIAPTIGGGAQTGLIKLVSGTGGITPQFVVSVNAHGILIQADNFPILPPAFGGPANQGLGPYIPLDAGAAYLQANENLTGEATGHWFLPTFNLAALQVEFGPSTTYAIYEVDFDFDYPGLAAILPVETITVPNPSVGTDWTWTLGAPAQLVGMMAELNPDATAANRLPYLWLGGGSIVQVPMTPAAITVASGALIMSGFIGANPPFQRSGDNRCTFPLPANTFLPTGSTIQTATGGLDAGDQWLNITLTFTTS